jgi:Zc3h12a-like Ribonuclease NYN domain
MSRAKPKPAPPKPEALREQHSKVVLVDGSNVAFSSEGERGVLKNIVTVRDRLVAEGFEPIVVADAALRHKIDDEVGYERLVSRG